MRPLPPELEAKIDEIKAWLFYGDVKELAKRARIKGPAVSAMLNKKVFPSKRMLDYAIDLMNENKARFECGPPPQKKEMIR